MAKNLKFFLLVIVAVSGLLFFYLNHSNDQILDQHERDFKITASESVTQIALSRNGQEISLQKKGDVWLINDMLVVETKINQLLNVLSSIQVKNRVANEVEDSLKNELITKGILVTVFENKNLLQSFYIGDDLSDSSGVYGVKKMAKTPFVLHQMGDKKLFNPLFSNDLFDWQSKIIFSTRENRIRMIQLEYLPLVQDSFSFSIEIDDQKLLARNHNNELLKHVDDAAIVEYIRLFSEISAIKLVSEPEQIEAPFFKLKIEQEGGGIKNKYPIQHIHSVILKGFRKKAAVGQKDFSGKTLEFDNETFFLQKGTTWYLVNCFTFDGILKSVEDFIE